MFTILKKYLWCRVTNYHSYIYLLTFISLNLHCCLIFAYITHMLCFRYYAISINEMLLHTKQTYQNSHEFSYGARFPSFIETCSLNIYKTNSKGISIVSCIFNIELATGRSRKTEKKIPPFFFIKGTLSAEWRNRQNKIKQKLTRWKDILLWRVFEPGSQVYVRIKRKKRQTFLSWVRTKQATAI